MQVTKVKVTRYDGQYPQTNGRVWLTDSRGNEDQELVFVFTEYGGDVSTDLDLVGPLGEEINYGDMDLDVADEDLGYVLTEYDPGSQEYVPTDAAFFLTEDDMAAAEDHITQAVSTLLDKARDAANVAFEEVLLGTK